jgi:hypothetical protein
VTPQVRQPHRNRPSARRPEPAPIWSVLLGTVTILAVTLLFAAPAFATAGPPKFHLEGVEEIYPTRVRLEIPLQPEGLETNWHTEYATSKEGPFTASDSGTITSIKDFAVGTTWVGSEESWYGIGHILRHLIPATTYYFRFVAENADGKVTKTVELATPPVAKPEIAHELYSKESTFHASSLNPTSLNAEAEVESNGAPTEYSFAYSSASASGPWTPLSTGASGSISVAEDIGSLSAGTTGLAPEKQYYVRLRATNEKGTVEEVLPVTTRTARPRVSETTVDNVTGSSAHLHSVVSPDGSKTSWRFESAPSATGPWAPVPGASGTVSQTEAKALPYEGSLAVSGDLSGLSPSTGYYVRLFAESEAGEGENYSGEPISMGSFIVRSLETEGPPSAADSATHALHGEAIRILGSVDPNSTPTSEVQRVAIEGAPSGGSFTLAFKGQTTAPIAFDASASQVQGALEALTEGDAEMAVNGPSGGPYTVEFVGALGGVDEPQIEADALGLTPSGSVAVSVTQAGGESYDIRYHFEYESQRQLEEGGGQPFADATSTPEVDLGSGGGPAVVGQDLPGLQAGETYHYRFVATSTFPGNPVIYGEDQSLTVANPTIEPQAPCENEAFRSGPSAHLPDCRAYEQVTPVDKEGAMELLNYGGSTFEGVLVGEDGDHVLVGAPSVDWGSGPTAGQSPYVFSRDPGKGWQMTAAAAQPETGVDYYKAQVFSPDLAQLGLNTEWQTSDLASSANIEFKVGAPGGPYATVASVPRADWNGVNEGAWPKSWVAASRDFSKLILSLPDHTLLGPTGTKTGEDLYEYSGGELRQVNVDSGGATIGVCGAKIVKGLESNGQVSSSHALSADGSRVFFEAVPGSDCSEPSHLYMRVDGESTVDLGAYTFLAANATGSEVLLKNAANEAFLYETEAASLKPLVYGPERHPLALSEKEGLIVSEDLNAIYFMAGKLNPEAPPTATGSTDLYRYDISTGTLRFVAEGSAFKSAFEITSASPDGRYLYFEAVAVAGVPAGGERLPGEEQDAVNMQVFRYDAAEGLVQCISCASPFDPAPRLNANFLSGRLGEGVLSTNQGAPRPISASANGDYVFFQTPAALLPSDVDGEIGPEVGGNGESEEHGSYLLSVSSDVYEWREPGVSGCAHPQGCLSLITTGKGGFHNVLLGTDESGRDVFFYTNESLVGLDNDTAGDIYDARIGGGFATPSRPVECEGDACSTPASPPNDATPSSFTFSGAGNLPPLAATTARSSKPKSKKGKPKKKKGKRRNRSRKGRRARKSSRERRAGS